MSPCLRQKMFIQKFLFIWIGFAVAPWEFWHQNQKFLLSVQILMKHNICVLRNRNDLDIRNLFFIWKPIYYLLDALTTARPLRSEKNVWCLLSENLWIRCYNNLFQNIKWLFKIQLYLCRVPYFNILLKKTYIDYFIYLYLREKSR